MQENEEPLYEEERRAIEVHKWYLSQKMGCDVGWAYAVEDWKRYFQSEWRHGCRKYQLWCNAEQARMMRDFVCSVTEVEGQEAGAQAEEEWVSRYAPQWRLDAESKMRRDMDEIEEVTFEVESNVDGLPSEAHWRHITVINEKGLHVRPSMCLKKLLDTFPDVEVCVKNVGTQEAMIRIREMTDILCLGAICGDMLLFGAQGKRAEHLLDEIERLFKELAERPF